MLEENRMLSTSAPVQTTKLPALSCAPKIKPQVALRTKSSAETDYMCRSRKAIALSASHWHTVQLAAAFAREPAYIIAEMLGSHGNSLHKWL